MKGDRVTGDGLDVARKNAAEAAVAKRGKKFS